MEALLRSCVEVVVVVVLHGVGLNGCFSVVSASCLLNKIGRVRFDDVALLHHVPLLPVIFQQYTKLGTEESLYRSISIRVRRSGTRRSNDVKDFSLMPPSVCNGFFWFGRRFRKPSPTQRGRTSSRLLPPGVLLLLVLGSASFLVFACCTTTETGGHSASWSCSAGCGCWFFFFFLPHLRPRWPQQPGGAEKHPRRFNSPRPGALWTSFDAVLVKPEIDPFVLGILPLVPSGS